MYRLGLTGAMASGKSTVLQIFAELGHATISADAAVRALYKGPAVREVEALFPGTAADGEVDRAALARRLAGHPDDLEKLESLLHPMVRRLIEEFLEAAEARGAGLAVAEIPLLFESGAYRFDGVAATKCPKSLARARALIRPGMSAEKFDFLSARQLSGRQKAARADFLIPTGGSLAATRAKVEALAQHLVGGSAA